MIKAEDASDVLKVSVFKLEAHDLALGLSEVAGRERSGRVNACTRRTLATGAAEHGAPICVLVSC